MDNVRWTSERDLEIGEWWAAFCPTGEVALIHRPCLEKMGKEGIGNQPVFQKLLQSRTGVCMKCEAEIDKDVLCLIKLQRIGMERKGKTS